MKALLITKDDNGSHTTLTEVHESELPQGDVTVRIDYSSLNYKDSLAITGKSPIVRKFPMVPGIDFAGTVEASTHLDFTIGDKVILNGWNVGESHWGGLAQKARVNGDWLVKLPTSFSARQAMAIGTAGYTAMLCVLKLEQNGITPDLGEILVTGATGGVGSIAIALLSKLGFHVVASTGRPDEHGEYLKSLGALDIIDRNTLAKKGRPLSSERWAGAIDTVGSHTLANICAALKYSGVVAACGLAQGSDLPATVMPFILRGITLAGINSVNCPKPKRIEAWRRLASNLDLNLLDLMTHEINLGQSLNAASDQLAGKNFGRIVVDVNA